MESTKTKNGKKLKTVEELYDKYKRKKGSLKKHLILGGVKFIIDPRYEIIDLGFKYCKNIIFNSWLRCLWTRNRG